MPLYKNTETPYIDARDYGAVGDGVTEDTVALQAAIDAATATGKTLIIPRGTYMTSRLNVSYGLSIRGSGFPTLLLKPNSSTWTRILTTESNLWSTTSPNEDSAPLSISGLIIDGNQLEQGPYTGYEKQHQAAIYLQGSNSGTYGNPRLRANIDNCLIKNTCGDGVSVWLGVDANVSRTFFWNCFRGSVVQIGGNSIVKANSISCGGDRHNSFFQAEIENNGRADTILTNSYFDHIRNDPSQGTGLDLIMGSNSNVTISNCYFGAGIYMIDGKDESTRFNFSNCIARQAASDIVRYGQLKFTGCTFSLVDGATSAFNLRTFEATGVSASFDNCTFETEGDPIGLTAPLGNITGATTAGNALTITLDTPHGLSAPGNYGFDVVYLQGLAPADYNGAYYVAGVTSPTELTLAIQKTYGAITPTNATAKLVPSLSAINVQLGESIHNTISARGCKFGFGFKFGVNMNQGGSITMRDNQVSSFTLGKLSSSSNYPTKADLARNELLDDCRIHFVLEATGGTSLVDLTLDEYVPIKSSFVRRFINTSGLTVRGRRTIYDSAAPSPTQYKFPSDAYENTTAALGYPTRYVNAGGYGTADTWRQVQYTMGSGPTANRPTLTTQDVGVTYFDTTLNAVVTFNGSAWVA